MQKKSGPIDYSYHTDLSQNALGKNVLVIQML